MASNDTGTKNSDASEGAESDSRTRSGKTGSDQRGNGRRKRNIPAAKGHGQELPRGAGIDRMADQRQKQRERALGPMTAHRMEQRGELDPDPSGFREEARGVAEGFSVGTEDGSQGEQESRSGTGPTDVVQRSPDDGSTLVVHRMSTTIGGSASSLEDKQITELKYPNQRPKTDAPAEKSNRQGDHTSAYVMSRDMIRNRFENVSIAGAREEIRKLTGEIRNLPGMQMPAKSLDDDRKQKRSEAQGLLTQAKMISKSAFTDEGHAGDQMGVALQKLLEARNKVPLSAHREVADRGKGEGVAQTLRDYEDHLNRKGTLSSQDKDEINERLWRLFDYQGPGNAPEYVVANIVLQHFKSIESSYPEIAKNIDKQALVDQNSAKTGDILGQLDDKQKVIKTAFQKWKDGEKVVQPGDTGETGEDGDTQLIDQNRDNQSREQGTPFKFTGDISNVGKRDPPKRGTKRDISFVEPSEDDFDE